MTLFSSHEPAEKLPENCHIGRNGNMAYFHTHIIRQSIIKLTSRRIAGLYQKYISGNSAILIVKYPGWLNLILTYVVPGPFMQSLLINSGHSGDAQ